MNLRGNWRAALRFLPLGMVAAGTLASASPPAPMRLGEPRLHLFYKASARLSEDILHRAEEFAAWNTVIGEGSAEEPADDALVVVPILNGPDGSGGEGFAEVPLMIRVVDAKGKVLGMRKTGAVFTGAGGRDHLALWLKDVTCAGPIRIEASLGAQKQQTSFAFNCGE